MAIFNLLASNIINLQLKLNGKLPVNRDELLALVNSWGRNNTFYINDKNVNEIKIIPCHANERYDLSNLDVSEISNFNDIFRYSYFNGDINSWDVSNATSMAYMFNRAKEFNQPLDNWNVLNVTSMYAIFYGAENFNHPLNSWEVSNVTSMAYMFSYTKEFNQPLNKWNTSNVNDINGIFTYTKAFNQNLNSWDISNIKDMNFMFKDAKTFNQPVLWDLFKVESCRNMFYNTKTFEDRFNNGKELPNETEKIKKWLKENRNKMIALDIENNKSKDLDNFLEKFNVIDSANLNGLHNDTKNFIK